MGECKVFYLDVRPLLDKKLFEKYFSRMSEFRKKKIMFYARQEDRNLSLGAGILTDAILKEYGLREKDMRYGLSGHGKPYFADREDICFNISHSGTYAMAVSASQSVGCDIEEDKTLDTDISALCLASGENKADLLKIWTMKESYLKKTGCGLNCDLTKLEAAKISNIYQIEDIKGYWAFVCTQEPSELIIKQFLPDNGEKL